MSCGEGLSAGERRAAMRSHLQHVRRPGFLVPLLQRTQAELEKFQQRSPLTSPSTNGGSIQSIPSHSGRRDAGVSPRPESIESSGYRLLHERGTLALGAAATLNIDTAATFYGASLASPRWPGILSGIDAARALKAPGWE